MSGSATKTIAATPSASAAMREPARKPGTSALSEDEDQQHDETQDQDGLDDLHQ